MTRNRWLLLFVALLVGWMLFGVRLGEWAHPGGRTADTPVPYPAETVANPASTPGNADATPSSATGSDEAVGRGATASSDASASSNAAASSGAADPSTLATPAASASGLPAEARATLRLIRQGGPFPYDRDGVVFGNFEGRLPAKPRGYYHEYTVATPGLSHRGPRRIVTGGTPPVEFYYTGDHYETFRRIEAEP